MERYNRRRDADRPIIPSAERSNGALSISLRTQEWLPCRGSSVGVTGGGGDSAAGSPDDIRARDKEDGAVGRPGRRRRGALRREGHGLGAMVRLAHWRRLAGLPPGSLVSRGHRVRPLEWHAGGAQWCIPLPAPDEQAGDVALGVRPQRHGHCVLPFAVRPRPVAATGHYPSAVG